MTQETERLYIERDKVKDELIELLLKENDPYSQQWVNNKILLLKKITSLTEQISKEAGQPEEKGKKPMTGKRFIQVMINSESDLPKGNDAYISHSASGHIGYRRCVPAKKQDHATFENISGEWWMKNIDWYLIEQPELEQRSAGEIISHFANWYNNDREHDRVSHIYNTTINRYFSECASTNENG